MNIRKEELKAKRNDRYPSTMLQNNVQKRSGVLIYVMFYDDIG